MASSIGIEAGDDSVKVAVHIRPLLEHEILRGCKHCVAVSPLKSQVQIGTHCFTFDHVYGSTGSSSSGMFKECVSPLVDGLFQGYNATVLAYGQTGSGKTYTMGTGFNDGFQNGLIPEAMNALFHKIQTLRDQCEFQLAVSFIEIHREELIDLLDSTSNPECAHETALRAAVPGKPPILIRESSNGVICLSGCTEVSVDSIVEMAACLKQGSLNRTTGSTEMNNHSSRSHAIFTILVEQRRKNRVLESDNTNGSTTEDYLCAKLHLVDLAGSERASKTGTGGLRFREGVHINKGLLALGNVICALGDKKRKGDHVPYRDSKLTRLLQDSLGGNSRTLMVACISPADINAEDTLNTLKYANRARNIQNKPVVNRDPVSREILLLRQQLEVLQAELSARGGQAHPTRFQDVNERIASLEAENKALSHELHMCRSRCAIVEDSDSATIKACEHIAKRSEGLKRGPPDQDSTENKMCEITDLTAEIREVDDFGEKREQEYNLWLSSLDKEFNELSRHFQPKESGMKPFGDGGFNSDALRQHSGRKMVEQDNEETTVQILNLKRKQENQIQLLKHKEKSDEAAKHLQDELKFMKSQKVRLQHKMKLEAEQYRIWKASRDKELLKLRKEGMRNDFERRKLQAFNQRQKLVLQRKTEEASVAMKRLKELLEGKKSVGRENAEHSNEGGSSVQINNMDLQRLLDHELDVRLNAREIRSEYERQSKLQASLVEELSNLKQVNEHDSEGLSPTSGNNESSSVSMMSPNAKASRIASLESLLYSSSNSLLAMASKLSEAEERESTFSNHGRWNQLRSMGDAKRLLQYMFANHYDAGCQLQDRDMEIKEMKEQMKELVERDVKLKEQNVAITLAASALQGDSPNSSDHLTSELSSHSYPKKPPAQKQLKYTPANISQKESATFFDQMIPASPQSTTPGKSSRKRSHHQLLLLHLKWKWEKPWKLSEWMKHSDETIISAKLPTPQSFSDKM